MSRDAEIVNIVASGRLLKCSGRENKTPSKSLDLLRISRELWNVQYNPRRFSAAIFRLRSCQQQQQQNKPQNVTVLLFSTGRVVCCGTKCKEQARTALRRFARTIQKLYRHRFNNNNNNDKLSNKIGLYDFKLENVVGAFRMGYGIDLSRLYELRGPQQCKWHQDRFPAGLRFRPTLTKRSCALVFYSGRCVITGCESEEEVKELAGEVRRILLRYRK